MSTAALDARILVLDGALFTLVAQRAITAAMAHDAYLRAGADIIKSATFTVLTDVERAPIDSAIGARAARAIADAWTAITPDQPRLVAGALSAAVPNRAAPPGARRAILAARIRGLIDGGVDLLLAETLASLDDVTAILAATAEACRDAPRSPPLMISVAVMPSGLLPSGETIDALCARLERSPPYSVGINCGAGCDGLWRPLETLAGALPCRVSCHPSAGVPDAFGDFDETPADTARFLGDAAAAGLIDIAGGCCGTTPEHVAAIAAAVRGLPARMAGPRA